MNLEQQMSMLGLKGHRLFDNIHYIKGSLLQPSRRVLHVPSDAADTLLYTHNSRQSATVVTIQTWQHDRYLSKLVS